VQLKAEEAQQQVAEMQQFLADYGLVWVGRREHEGQHARGTSQLTSNADSAVATGSADTVITNSEDNKMFFTMSEMLDAVAVYVITSFVIFERAMKLIYPLSVCLLASLGSEFAGATEWRHHRHCESQRCNSLRAPRSPSSRTDYLLCEWSFLSRW